MNTELIIFDLDGTLVDSSDDIAVAANMTLKELGVPEKSDKVIRACIGWGVKVLLEGLLARELALQPSDQDARALVARATEIFLDRYGERLVVNTALYPGVGEALDHFMGESIPMAICTNKPLGFTEEIVEKLSIAEYFKTIVGGDTCKNKKPHPEPLTRVLDNLKVAPSKAVFVGDSAIDCEAGQRAGIVTIGAGWGFRGSVALTEWGCEKVMDNMTELVDIVE